LFENNAKKEDKDNSVKVDEQTMDGKWGWYNILFRLANEDILKINTVTKIKIYETLTFLCYQQDYNRELKKQQQKSIV